MEELSELGHRDLIAGLLTLEGKKTVILLNQLNTATKGDLQTYYQVQTQMPTMTVVLENP